MALELPIQPRGEGVGGEVIRHCHSVPSVYGEGSGVIVDVLVASDNVN